MQFKEAIETFKQVEAAKGKIEKENLIRENKDNKLFGQMLYFLYNDMITTGIAIKKFDKESDLKPNIDLANIREAMKYVMDNNTGREQVVVNLKHFISSFGEETQTFLKAFFTKTYKCGVTSSTINKAFDKKFIPVFGVMLAHPYEKHAAKLKGKKFFLTRKLDGHRMVAIVNMNKFKVSFYTRKGKKLEGFDELETNILNFVNVNKLDTMERFKNGIVIDGEALLTDRKDMDETEWFQATGKELKKKGLKSGVSLHAFEIIPADEFKNDESEDVYEDRRHWCEELTYPDDLSVQLVEKVYEGGDVEKVEELLNSIAIPGGWEGLMVNMASAKYVTKRSAGLLKVKKFKYADIEVIDVYEGEKGKKNEGLMGGVVCRFKDFTVDIGSGWTDKQRIDFWSQPELIIGKIIEIQYQGETTNDDGGKGLRFPTVQRIRMDKTVDDVSYES
ncbi:ATP-dependent DNA ligase [Vagococcus elongatus]|uniref:DNA ligase n=1 Tax=Vagococcus elongatus TaxID=180344 RepID=A0A430AVY8_9ENTE|nr:hypothetical protein [Vagococcus elongatus]RSU12219.1 hypothetical protein CBF29_06370 [Vagococcus elongatus]